MLNKILKLVFLLIIMFIFIGCNEVSVVSIEMSEFGKDTYLMDEEFDPQGFILTVKYSDGNTKQVSLTADMCDLTVMGVEGKHTINVTYTEEGKSFSTSFDVIIGGVTAKSLSVKVEGKKIYSSIDELDLSGYVFEVVYSDATTKEVTGTSDTKTTKDTWGIADQKLTDFVDKIKEVGNNYHIPVIDNYNALGINEFNHKTYLVGGTDGCHPTAKGLELMSRHIAYELF